MKKFFLIQKKRKKFEQKLSKIDSFRGESFFN
jgi:hypothetical protein